MEFSGPELEELLDFLIIDPSVEVVKIVGVMDDELPPNKLEKLDMETAYSFIKEIVLRAPKIRVGDREIDTRGKEIVWLVRKNKVVIRERE